MPYQLPNLILDVLNQVNCIFIPFHHPYQIGDDFIKKLYKNDRHLFNFLKDHRSGEDLVFNIEIFPVVLSSTLTTNSHYEYHYVKLINETKINIKPTNFYFTKPFSYRQILTVVGNDIKTYMVCMKITKNVFSSTACSSYSSDY